jgi:uncharacterized protein YecE (DUF72 family)
MQHFYSGTSGLVLPVKNKLEYPEEYRSKSRLHYYSTLFNSIEVNSVFYKLPRQQTVERWSHEVTGDFKFSFKLSKEITHCRDLIFDKAAINNFFGVINVPDKNKGCILIQFPGKISADYTQQLKKLLTLVSKHTSGTLWRLAVEFRHVSWYDPSTKKLLEPFNATCVIHDIKPFTTELLTNSKTIFIRFHGTEKNYRGSYDDALLADYALKIKTWIKEDRTVFAYFNNTLGPAVQNLISLNSLVRK